MDAAISRRQAMIGAGSVLTAALVAGSATAEAASSGAARSAAPVGALVMIIRHAEKPKGHHKPYGITDEGEQDKESLTVRGWTRAGALVELFDPVDAAGDAPLRAGLHRPDRIVAARPGHGSKRPLETITPLAERLGHSPITTWAKGQETAVGKALDSYRGVSLVAWEHEKIPAIIKAMGAVTPAPPSSWPSDRFDLIWVLRRTQHGWSFHQLPQLLLSGDSRRPA